MRASSRLFLAAVAATGTSAIATLAFAGPETSRFPQAPEQQGQYTMPEAVVFSEGFDTVPPAGWVINNQSANASAALTSWFQGNPAVFPAHSGATSSYAGANFNNTTGTNTISDWLIAPAVSGGLQSGDVVHFFTRTVTAPAFPDRLQLRMSPTGGTNPGAGPTSTGDFSTLLVDINPTYSVTGYPNAWTEFTATISGNFPAGRLAFRYFVENGGPSGANSDYIGVDTMFVDRPGGGIPEPASLGLIGLGGLGLVRRRRQA
jgi:hypothetical protein